MTQPEVSALAAGLLVVMNSASLFFFPNIPFVASARMIARMPATDK